MYKALNMNNGCVRIKGKNRDFPYGKITIFPGNANTPIDDKFHNNKWNVLYVRHIDA